MDQPHLFDSHTASSVAQENQGRAQDLGPRTISWNLGNIFSDHLPILVEIDLKVKRTGVKKLHWNFKKADWSLFENISNDLISPEPISDNLEKEVEKYVKPSQIGLFAGDVVLWYSNANITKMESQLNRSLVNIQEFADNHKLTFNDSKSTVSLFTTNRHL
ncbi:hypothetical protein TNIN_69441 [Trichonephila inaurata madagascariensis]|uniref:Reverse transcriptase n=1 Tax=Trichonephila inaurata madagascariensis TaxID=2747483 RepID=A0A8X6YK60_9ARAC|nr:hypothetical protein TNIN_69441 [Trichonephila inaurata madagascariensis]